MLTETARVVAVEEGSVWVETIRQSVCGRCAVRQGCGHRLLNRLGGERRNRLELSSSEFPAGSFQVDDQVLVGVPEQLVVNGAFTVYMLPLLTMLLAAAVAPGWLPWSPDTAAVAGALGGLAAGIALVRRHGGRHFTAPRLLGPAPC